MEKIEERVKEIVCEKLEIGTEGVTLQTNLEYMGADSLDVAEILLALEREYEIRIDNERLTCPLKIETLANIVNAEVTKRGLTMTKEKYLITVERHWGDRVGLAAIEDALESEFPEEISTGRWRFFVTRLNEKEE